MTSSLTAFATRSRTALAQGRHDRAAQQRLRAELASYRTPAERAELAAVLSRHTAQERDLLATQAGSRYYAS